jgi:transposase InsO family protein
MRVSYLDAADSEFDEAIAYYNFCRIHSSIRCTPAMEAGITNTVWTLRDLLTA